jgi:hypothetical protein
VVCIGYASRYVHYIRSLGLENEKLQNHCMDRRIQSTAKVSKFSTPDRKIDGVDACSETALAMTLMIPLEITLMLLSKSYSLSS